MFKAKALIIEDNSLNSNLLNSLLIKYCPRIEVVGISNDIEASLRMIEHYKPNLLFLDIILNNENGLDIIRLLKNTQHKVIIVSAYNNFALDALRLSVIDYILKPIDITALVDAVNKYLDNYYDIEIARSSNFIALPSKNDYQLVSLNDVIRLESSKNYTVIHIKNHNSTLVSKTLKHFEDKLPIETFIRIHKSHIININFIERLSRAKGMSILMKDNIELPVSEDRKNSVLSKIIL